MGKSQQITTCPKRHKIFGRTLPELTLRLPQAKKSGTGTSKEHAAW